MKTVNKVVTFFVIIFSVGIIFMIGYFIFYYPTIIYYNPQMDNVDTFKEKFCKVRTCISYDEGLTLKNSSITLQKESGNWTLKYKDSDDKNIYYYYINENEKIKIISTEPTNPHIKKFFYYNYITKKLSNFSK